MLRIEHLAYTSRWTRRHPAEKVVLGFGLLLLSLVLPPLPGAPLVLGAAVGAAVWGARTPAAEYARVMAPPVAFLAAGALALAVSLRLDGEGPWLSFSAAGAAVAAETSLRALAATASLLLIILTTPIAEVLGLLRRAGLPASIVDMMLLIYRFVAIALDVAATGRRAQEARLGYDGLRRSIRSTGLLAASLLPRVLDRATRMQHGLAARGYAGELRVLAPARALSVRFVALALLSQAAIALVVYSMPAVAIWRW